MNNVQMKKKTIYFHFVNQTKKSNKSVLNRNKSKKET